MLNYFYLGTDAKVRSIIIKKVTEWKRFARRTQCSDNVDAIVSQIDHDVRGGDESKMESFLTKLIELRPNDYITYIKKSLKAIGKNNVLQDITSICMFITFLTDFVFLSPIDIHK